MRDISGSIVLDRDREIREGLIIRQTLPPFSFADLIKLKPLSPEGDVVVLFVTDGD